MAVPGLVPGINPAIPTGTGIAKEAVTSCNGAGGDGRVKPSHDALGQTRTYVTLFAGWPSYG